MPPVTMAMPGVDNSILVRLLKFISNRRAVAPPLRKPATVADYSKKSGM